MKRLIIGLLLAAAASAQRVSWSNPQQIYNKPFVDVRDHGARGDWRAWNLASISLGSTNLSVTDGAFTTGDVGKTVVVTGAGAGGAALVATITSRTSSTAVVISVPADTGVSGATGGVGTDSTDGIQAAITAANAGGLSVMIPGGSYMVRPSTSRYITVPVGSSIHGEGIGTSKVVVMPGTGAYRKIFYSSDCTGCSFHNFTIDGNISRNPCANDGSDCQPAKHERIPINIQGGSGIRISNMEFVNSSATNEILISPALGNTARDVIITNNIFRVIGDDPNHVVHDTSVVYVDATNSAISSNVFTGVAPDYGSGTAIETHGSNTTISNNTIDTWITGILPTGQNASEDTVGVIISGNTIKNVRYGISFWSQGSGAHTTGYGIVDWLVHGNTITLSPENQTRVLLPSECGICLYGDTSLPVKGLSIISNSIRWSSIDTGGRAISNDSGGIVFFDQGSMTFSNIRISGNVIDYAPSAGIRLSGASIGTRFKNCSISHNIIRNAGSTLYAVDPSVPYPINLASTFSNLIVEGNQIIDDFATTRMKYAVLMLTRQGYSDGIVFRNNVVSLQGATKTAFLGWFDIKDADQSKPLIIENIDDFSAPAVYVANGSIVNDWKNNIMWKVWPNGLNWMKQDNFTVDGSGYNLLSKVGIVGAIGPSTTRIWNIEPSGNDFDFVRTGVSRRLRLCSGGGLGIDYATCAANQAIHAPAGYTILFDGVTYGDLAAIPNGSMGVCNDCKNVADDGAVAGAVCSAVPTGNGAKFIKINGKALCN